MGFVQRMDLKRFPLDSSCIFGYPRSFLDGFHIALPMYNGEEDLALNHLKSSMKHVAKFEDVMKMFS